jgi:hypothetical protein
MSARAAAPRRRDMLQIIAALGLLAASFPLGAATTARGGGPLGDAEPLRRLGVAYLREHAGEADRRWLSRHLFGGAVPRDAAALMRRIAEQRARDLAEGDIVTVQGWLLARSEARLCALLAMTPPSA